MATISKDWSDATTVYQTNAYSGSDADVTTIVYTDNIDLETSGYEGAQIRVTYDGDNATDNFIVTVYAALTSSHDTDEGSTHYFSFPGSSSEKIYTIVIKDFAHFYLGLARSGTSTTFDVDVTYKAWRWQSS